MTSIDFRRFSKIAISLAYYVSTSFARHLLRLLGRPASERLTILYYHGVPPDFRSSFASQMEALHRGAVVVPASYAGRIPRRRGKKYVAITFDDAFVSLAQNGINELEKYSFHSTVFVPVAWIGRPPGWELEAPTTGSAKQPELSEVVMSLEQLQALGPNVSLGSHTMTHPHLPELGPDEILEEIAHSRIELARLTGREILELSFPYGEHDATTIVACRAADYSAVYSIIPEEVDTTCREVLRGRTKVDPSDGRIEFFLKYNGSYEWMRYSTGFLKTFRRRARG
jgi:peptidoglycan/xylan/chitin deacetylase (PgdA/CDA1 family)